MTSAEPAPPPSIVDRTAQSLVSEAVRFVTAGLDKVVERVAEDLHVRPACAKPAILYWVERHIEAQLDNEGRRLVDEAAEWRGGINEMASAMALSRSGVRAAFGRAAANRLQS